MANPITFMQERWSLIDLLLHNGEQALRLDYHSIGKKDKSYLEWEVKNSFYHVHTENTAGNLI